MGAVNVSKSGTGVEIVCELFFEPDAKLHHKQAKVIETALKKAAAEAFPGVRIKGLFVHTRVKP